MRFWALFLAILFTEQSGIALAETYCAATIATTADGNGSPMSIGYCPDGSAAIQAVDNFYCTSSHCTAPYTADQSRDGSGSGAIHDGLGLSGQTPGSAPTAAQVSAETQAAFQRQVAGVARDSAGTQQASLQDATAVASLGANHAATVGAIFCAEGALKVLADPEQGASDFAACQNHFTIAKRLSSSALKPDPQVLGAAGAIDTFAKFESSFGVGRDDYLSRLLGAKGSRETLGELLGSAVPAEKLNAAYATADTLPPQQAPSDFSVNLGGSRTPAGGAADSQLRAKLRARLEHAASDVAPEEDATLLKSSRDDHLEPFAHEEVFGVGETVADAASLGEAQGGLTLFEVVHRRYDSLARRHRPR